MQECCWRRTCPPEGLQGMSIPGVCKQQLSTLAVIEAVAAAAAAAIGNKSGGTGEPEG